jgi:Tol biopolymer transport system component
MHTMAADPETGKGDPDGRLINIKTGRMRRIPFEGEASIPGCFLSGRDKVVVTGMSDSRFGLYEIDLKTRKNHPLAAKVLAGTFPLAPVLSPDGKTLAVASADFGAGLDHTQVFLIDLQTGEGKPIGKPFDTTALSWMPDGKGLILVSRQNVRMDKPPVSTICRMDLIGQLTPLRPGDSPVLLQDGRILFEEYSEDGRHWQWKTCNLSGQDVKLFGDGLKKLSFPAPAPDGLRMLMIRYVPDRGTTPYVFRIGEAPDQPAVQVGGTWSGAVWR